MNRELGEHRVPGVCASLLGFLLAFAGAMLVSLGIMKQDFNNSTLKIAGCLVLVGGIVLVTFGFSHQFITHRKWKRRRQRKEQRRKHRKATKYEVQQRTQHAGKAVTADEIVLTVEDLSEPMPSSSGIQSAGSSANSSWSSLSDIPDESKQPESSSTNEVFEVQVT
jgi:uncharacterized membrane protein